MCMYMYMHITCMCGVCVHEGGRESTYKYVHLYIKHGDLQFYWPCVLKGTPAQK